MPEGEGLQADEAVLQRGIVLKSVNIGGLAVMPIPAEVRDKVSCTHCQVRAARWEIGEWNYACSTCFLYELPVMRPQQEALGVLIAAVEKTMGYLFPRNDENRVEGVDADRVVSGIVLAQRFELNRGLK